jgi:hypothetical protein
MNYIIKYSLILIVLIVLLFVPESIIYTGTSLCIFKNITGIQCPLCGLTRASCDLLHFRIGSALHYNPVSLFLPLLLMLEIIHDIFPSAFPAKYIRITWLVFSIALGFLFIYRIMYFFAVR